MSENVPDLIDVLQTWFESFSRDLHTAFPGRIESYDASKCTATVKPLIKHALEDEDGNLVSEELPSLPNVPIQFPGIGDWFMTMPVSVGDLVLVLACEASIGHIRQTGEITEPGDLRRHHLSHSVAIAGFSKTSQTVPGDQSGLVLGKRNGPTIKIAGNGDVVLNGGGASVGRVGDGVNVSGTPLSGMLGWMGQVTAACNSAVPGSVTIPIPTQLGTIAVGASSVKA